MKKWSLLKKKKLRKYFNFGFLFSIDISLFYNKNLFIYACVCCPKYFWPLDLIKSTDLGPKIIYIRKKNFIIFLENWYWIRHENRGRPAKNLGTDCGLLMELNM